MHPLWGPIRKAERAEDQVEALVATIDAFLDADRYGVRVGERNPKTGKYPLYARVSNEAQPPLRWSIEIGEIAYNLRSCLDQLACVLAVANPANHPPYARLWKQTAFPICLYGPRSRGHSRDETWRPGMNSIAFMSDPQRTILQGFQPYSRRNRQRHHGPIRYQLPIGKRHPLWLLHELNNADKHRLIQVTARVASGMGMIIHWAPPEFVFRSIKTNLGVKLVDGAYIGAIDADGLEKVNMHLSLSPDVVFWEGCDAVKGLPVRATIKALVNQVHYHTLVPLCAELPPLDPPWGPPP